MRINKQTISLALSLISVAGVGLTSFLSVKGYKKASEETEKKEIVKSYAPAIFSGVATCACILGSYGLSRKEIITLTAAAGCLASNKSKLEQKIQEKFGSQSLLDTKQESITESIDLPKRRNIEATGKGSMIIFEEFSGRLFYSSMEAVDEAESRLTERYRNGHRICLNDFYGYLGIESTSFGNNWGWMPDLNNYNPKYYDDNPLCFDDRIVEDTTTKKPVRIISFYNFPTSNWMYDI